MGIGNLISSPNLAKFYLDNSRSVGMGVLFFTREEFGRTWKRFRRQILLARSSSLGFELKASLLGLRLGGTVVMGVTRSGEL